MINTDEIKLLNVTEKLLLLDSLLTKNKNNAIETIVYRVKLVANRQPSPASNKNLSFCCPQEMSTGDTNVYRS